MEVMAQRPEVVGWKLRALVQVAAGVAVTAGFLGAIEVACGVFVPPEPVAVQPAALRNVAGDAVSKTLMGINLNPAPLVADVDLLWRNKPLASKTQPVNPRRFGRNDTWSIAINSEGFRGPERLDKDGRDGVYRILCIGDSVTFGFNTDQDAPFARRVEDLLRTQFPSRRFEVINAGVPGWSWVQGLRFLETKGLALHPNLVIMAHGMNDQFWIAKITDSERIRALEDPWVRGLQAASDVLWRTNTYQAVRRLVANSQPVSTDSPGCQRQIRETGVCRRVSLAEIEAAIHAAHRRTAAAGIDLLVLNLEFMETAAVQGARRAVDADGIPFVDFVADFNQWRQADEDERAHRLGLAAGPAGPGEPMRAAAHPLGERYVVLRVWAAGLDGNISVKGSSFGGGEFPLDEAMYDDGTHGDETGGDGVFSVAIAIPAAVAKIRYKYYVNGIAKFTALPPLPSSHHDRVRLFEPGVAPIEIFGAVPLMAELAHPNAEGHERIASRIVEELRRFDSFAHFVGPASGAPAAR
jgi:lysophospholipase L1-like esterase